MKYRVRNVRTDQCVVPENDFQPENQDPEWVLECEAADGDWITSGFHVRDLLGVKDPRPFEEAISVLRGAS